MCAKRPSPRRELPISPEDCTLPSDAMMLLFEDMSFDFAAHGLDYDHADAAYELLRDSETAYTLLQIQAIDVLVQQALARLSDPSFQMPELEQMEPGLFPKLRSSTPRLSELSKLLTGYAKPPQRK